MTDTRRSGRAHRRNRAGWPACGAVLAVTLLAAGAAMPREGASKEPLSPPAVAPVSRLTITPSDFERWMAGTPDRPDVAAVPEDQPRGGGLVAPPPPTLVTPPRAPELTTPPPSPRLALPPAASLPESPAMPPAATVAEPPELTRDAVSPPPAPVLTPPEAPQIATLPPDSSDTTPVPAEPEPLPRPAEIRIHFAADATELPEAARADLNGLASWLRANPDVRVQIVGYASAATTTGSDARRRALFRTLAVRTYLIENGVLSTRMDVRALGDRTEEEPKDRVEVRLPPS